MNLEVKREPLAINNPPPPDIRNYEIYVVTEENVEEVMDRLKEKGQDPVLFGLSDKGYEIKSLNDKRTVNYIQKLRSILEEYRNYYESEEE